MKSAPTLVYYRGRLLPDALRRERLTEAELYAAARSTGIGSFEEVDAIVLESDGKLSVLRGGAGQLSAIDGTVETRGLAEASPLGDTPSR